MVRVLQTEAFARWLRGLRDSRAVDRIVARVLRIEQGRLGDARPVGGGVSEMRIDYGPGYRFYFIRREVEVIVLLCGGDKSSQRRDIERAKRIAAGLEGSDA